MSELSVLVAKLRMFLVPGNPVEYLFFALIGIVFTLGVVGAIDIFLRNKSMLRRVGRALEVLDRVKSEDELSLIQAAVSTHPGLAKAWAMFESKLVKRPGENYFAPESLTSLASLERQFGRTSVRFLPGFTGRGLFLCAATCTGLGVVGTFVGLTDGLSSLNIKNLDRLSGEVGDLIMSLSTAFKTSILGVASSLVLNVVVSVSRERVELRYAHAVSGLDRLFERLSQEQLLRENGDYLRVMHGELQESRVHVQQIADDIADRLACGFENSLKETLLPALLRMQGVSDVGDKDEPSEGPGGFIDDLSMKISESFTAGFEDISGVLNSMAQHSQSTSEVMAEIAQVQRTMLEAQRGFRQQIMSSTEVLSSSIGDSSARNEGLEELRAGMQEVTKAIQQSVQAQNHAQDRAAARLEQSLNQGQVSPGVVENLSSQLSQLLERALPAAEGMSKSFSELQGCAQALTESNRSLQQRSELEDRLLGMYRQASQDFVQGVKNVGPIAHSLNEIAISSSKQAASMASSIDTWRGCSETFRQCAAFIQQEVPKLNHQLHATVRQVHELPTSMNQVVGHTIQWAEKTANAIETFSAGLNSSIEGSLSQYDASLSSAVSHLKGAIGELEDALDVSRVSRAS